MKYWAIGLSLIYATLAFGATDGWSSMRGRLRVAPEPLSDPIAEAQPVAYFIVEGPAAKAMFDRMKGFKSTRDACGEPGMVARTVGDVVCYRMKASYSCEFGVRLSDGIVRPGRAC